MAPDGGRRCFDDSNWGGSLVPRVYVYFSGVGGSSGGADHIPMVAGRGSGENPPRVSHGKGGRRSAMRDVVVHYF